jgi:hypothetical protein
LAPRAAVSVVQQRRGPPKRATQWREMASWRAQTDLCRSGLWLPGLGYHDYPLLGCVTGPTRNTPSPMASTSNAGGLPFGHGASPESSSHLPIALASIARAPAQTTHHRVVQLLPTNGHDRHRPSCVSSRVRGYGLGDRRTVAPRRHGPPARVTSLNGT